MTTAPASKDSSREGHSLDIQDSSLRVIEADFRTDPRWIDFLSNHRDALIYHHPGWLASLEAEYGNKCVALACEGPDGRFLGVLPLLVTRGIPFQFSANRVGRRLSSLARTPVAGPLATDDRVMTALLRVAMERARAQKNTQLELKTTQPGLDRLVPELECIPWRDTWVRGTPVNDLPARDLIGPQLRETRSCTSCDICRILTFGNARGNHQVRWAVNKAAKQGLSLRAAQDESDLRSWYRLYLRTMRRNVVPPRPYRFFRQLLAEMAAQGNVELFLAERGTEPSASRQGDGDRMRANTSSPLPDAAIVGGSILLQYGHTVFWAFTGMREERASLHATDLTLWDCIHTACRRGYDSFDLGEVAENHPELSQFKAKWGTVRRPLYRYYYPAHASRQLMEGGAAGLMMSAAASVWRRLPLGVTAALGDAIFRHL